VAAGKIVPLAIGKRNKNTVEAGVSVAGEPTGEQRDWSGFVDGGTNR